MLIVTCTSIECLMNVFTLVFFFFVMSSVVWKYLPTYLPTCLPACLPIYLSISPSIYLSVCLSVCLYLCLPVCHSILTGSPRYFADLLHVYVPSHLPRSSSDNRIFRFPTLKTKHNSQGSFSFQAPKHGTNFPTISDILHLPPLSNLFSNLPRQ